MRRLYIIYIIGILLLGFSSCANEELVPAKKEGTLELTVSRFPIPVVSTRAVEEDLNVDVVDPSGEEPTKHFAAGAVPSKIALTADKEYRIVAYTSNQNTWQTANGGLGEPCFWGETTATVEEDATVYVTYQVPMIRLLQKLYLYGFRWLGWRSFCSYCRRSEGIFLCYQRFLL